MALRATSAGAGLLLLGLSLIWAQLAVGQSTFAKYFYSSGTSSSLIQPTSGGAIAISKTDWGQAQYTSYARYTHGIFKQSIKLPSGYSAGIVTAFYVSSLQPSFTQKGYNTRDELDFEFLGNTWPEGILIATNYYSGGRGQDIHEEGFYIWFDPSTDYHTYTIKYGLNVSSFWVDDVPLRVVRRQPGDVTCAFYPCKPVYMQTSIWDASAWATDGGAIPANYAFAPFTSSIHNIDVTKTCSFDKHEATACSLVPGPWDVDLTAEEEARMAEYRQKYLKYSNVIGCGNSTQPSCSSVNVNV